MGEERRKHKRFAVMRDLAEPLEIIFDTGVASSVHAPGVMANLSAGGMCIVTFNKIEVGTKVKLKIDIPGLKTDSIEGKVVWLKAKNGTYQFGISFTKIGKESLDKINKMAEDNADCETKLGMGVHDVCFPDCKYLPLCTKKERINK